MKSDRTIILIEDDQMIREGLKDFLEAEGFTIVTAENGKIGLEMIRAQSGACLILLDLQMPVMTGEQLLEALQAEPTDRDVAILVLSARAEQFIHPGIKAFVRKPIDLDDLLEKVAQHCH